MRAVVISFFLLTALLARPDASSPRAAQGVQTSCLPAEIRLFPLPETTLFPDVTRPFLILEPRYREMVADTLEGDQIIGMVRLRPGFEKD